jgi:hypothetical protein
MAIAKETDQTQARLRELGFDPQAAPDSALATLRQLRGTPGVSDGAIAHALGNIAATESAAMLAGMEAGATGTTRREIRRALFRLRQRGIAAPAPAAPVAAQPATGADSGLIALLSPADADGTRIAWLLKPRTGGGLKRLWGLVSETEGLLGATLDTLSRKEFRAERAEVERRAGTPFIDADWRLVDFILYDAYRHTPEARRGRVGNFLALRTEIIAASPPTEFTHPIYLEFTAAAAAEPSVDLMREPEVAAFQLPAAAVKPFADEVSNLNQSVIVLARVQQEERINTVVERALGELLTGDNGYRLRRHLEDSGYCFAHSGKPLQAGWAAAAAAIIRDGAELKRVAFFQTFMRAQLGALLAEKREQEQQETRLIMTPAEAMRARQAAQARMRQRPR